MQISNVRYGEANHQRMRNIIFIFFGSNFEKISAGDKKWRNSSLGQHSMWFSFQECK